MTTRNLDALLAPKAIALVGASNQPGSVGNVLARNLLSGGFSGPIMLLNPHDREVCGVQSFQNISDLPTKPDLAVVATPPRVIPQLISELGQGGCRAAVVVTAGFDKDLRAALLSAGRPYLLRVVGPNCLGLLSPVSGVNASFAHLMPQRGRLAFVTQSGAIATSVIDWAIGKKIGFSHIVSLGDMSDVDFGDLLDFLALDPETDAVLLYAETITHARKFMSAGRIASRAKPVIVVKGGRSAAGAAAAASHTGALAGADAVYDAALRRAGMLRVGTLRELFDAVETLASGLRVHGDRLTILTNGGGLGVLAADALENAGGKLALLSKDVRAHLDASLPAAWSHGNPIDILGDAHGDRYEAALDALSMSTGSDCLLAMNCPTGVADSMDAAGAVVRAKEKRIGKPIIACWMGEASTAIPRALLSQAGVPNYETPDEAVTAFLHLAEYSRNQRALFETPSLHTPDRPNNRDDAWQIIHRVISENRATLTEPEAKAVLAAYHIPVVTTRTVGSAEAAGQAAEEIGGDVALKILSREITHKSDVGGVRLDLVGAKETSEAAIEMLSRVSKLRPDAAIDGFTVQQMVKRPHAQELLLGAVVDQTFGPCLMFGQGGVATEIIADRCIGLPPLNINLAKDMISRTRVAKLLAGYRDRAPARLDDVVAALVALSDLVIDFPEITELDINPLIADAEGVVALDARIIVRKRQDTLNRLAIKPYPADLIQALPASNPPMVLRPIRPEDAALLLDFAQRTAPNDLRLRFHGAVSLASPATAARLSQIDYDREMVFLAEMKDSSISGVVRLVFDPNYEAAECAIIVRSDMHGRGIGTTLLNEALAYAGRRGASLVWGDVLTCNTSALDLARKLGGQIRMNPEDPELRRVEFGVPAHTGR
jgi:acetyltransferase